MGDREVDMCALYTEKHHVARDRVAEQDHVVQVDEQVGEPHGRGEIIGYVANAIAELSQSAELVAAAHTECCLRL